MNWLRVRFGLFDLVQNRLKSPVVLAGHPMLRVPAQQVKPADFGSQKIQVTREMMLKAFMSKVSPVLGLSAPQVGVNLAMIAWRKDIGSRQPSSLSAVTEDQVQFVVNPKLEIQDSKPRQKWNCEYECCEVGLNGSIKS